MYLLKAIWPVPWDHFILSKHTSRIYLATDTLVRIWDAAGALDLHE